MAVSLANDLFELIESKLPPDIRSRRQQGRDYALARAWLAMEVQPAYEGVGMTRYGARGVVSS